MAKANTTDGEPRNEQEAPAAAGGADVAVLRFASLASAKQAASAIPDILMGYDVFVSYAWRDGRPYAFALAAALREKGYRCFLDDREMAGGVELSPAVELALRRSSALVAIVTAGALRSPHVAKEVEAFSRTRRPLVPIFLDAGLREIGKGATLRTLAARVWIDEPAGPLAAGSSPGVLERLVQTFQFVRRNRIRMLAAWVAAGLFAFLFVVTFINYRLAEQRRLQSLSRELSIAAREAPGADKSLLISVQALKAADTPEARGNLMERHAEWRALRRIVHLDRRIDSVVAPPEPSAIAIGTDDGVFSWREGGSVPERISHPRGGSTTALALVGDDLWVGSEGGSVEVQGPSALNRSPLPEATVEAPPGRGRMILAIASGHGLVAIGDATGRLRILDARTKEVKANLDETDELRVEALAFDPEGRRLAAGTGSGRVLLIDASTFEVTARFPRIDGGVLALGWVGDGSLAVVGSMGDLTVLRATPDGLEREHSAFLAGLPASAAIDGDRQRVALGDASGWVRVYDLFGNPIAFEASRGHSDAVSAVAFVPGSDRLVSASSNGTAATWDLSGGMGIAEDLPAFSPEPTLLRARPGGGIAAAATTTGDAGAWLLQGTSWTRMIDLLEATRAALGPETMEPAPDERGASPDGFVPVGELEVPSIAMDRAGRVVAWTTRRGAVLHAGLDRDPVASVIAREGASGDLAISSDGTTVAYPTDENRSVTIVTLTGRPRPRTATVPEEAVPRSLALSRDGAMLAVGMEDGTIALHDGASGEPRSGPAPVHRGAPVALMAFEESGRRLVSAGSGGGGADRALAVSSLPTLTEVRRLQVRQAGGSVSSLALDEGLGLLAAGDRDGQVLIWDLRGLRFLAQLTAGSMYVPSILLDDARSRLVSVSSDGVFSAWGLDPARWIALACEKANRPLRPDEWQELQPDDLYDATCP